MFEHRGFWKQLMSSQRVNGEVDSRQSRILDRNSEYLGVSTLQLMENAGKAVADEVAGKFPAKTMVSDLAGYLAATSSDTAFPAFSISWSVEMPRYSEFLSSIRDSREPISPLTL